MFPPGATPRSANHSGDEIGDDITVKIGHNHNVVLARFLHQLHAHVVDYAVVAFNVRILGGDFLGHAEKEPVGELHDVRLVDDRDLPALVRPGVLKREFRDLAGVLFGDNLDADRGCGIDLLLVQPIDGGDDFRCISFASIKLNAGVHALQILANYYQIDVREGALNALDGLPWAQVGVETKFLSQSDIDTAEALADRRGGWSLDADRVALD